MERETKKIKKDGDTCRDCWVNRFRTDIHDQWGKGEKKATPGTALPLSKFLNHELQIREDEIKNMRELFTDLYDEISAIKNLAGDVYMGRFDKEKGDQSS